MTPYTIYWLTRLDSISVIATVLMWLLGVGIVIISVILITNLCDNEKEKNKLWFIKTNKINKILIIFFCLCLAICAFVPSTNEAIAIYLLPTENTVNFLNQRLKFWIENSLMEKKNETNK